MSENRNEKEKNIVCKVIKMLGPAASILQIVYYVKVIFFI